MAKNVAQSLFESKNLAPHDPKVAMAKRCAKGMLLIFLIFSLSDGKKSNGYVKVFGYSALMTPQCNVFDELGR